VSGGRPARVLYVVDHLKVGGAQTHLVELLTRLDRGRFLPAVCALKKHGDLVGTVQDLGVPVHDGGLGHTLAGAGGVRVVWRLARLLRAERVDLAHAYLFHPNVVTPVAARLAGTRAVVVSKRSLDRYPGRGERLAVRLGNRLASRVLVNAEAIGRFVAGEEGCPTAKMVLVPNGVSDETLGFTGDRLAMRRQLGLLPDAPVAIALSRLAWKKGVRHLVEATPRLLEAVPNAYVLIAGDGDLRDELATQARTLGVAERVRFLGTRRDALDLLHAADVFVMPSVVEGMSNALLEAMAVGLPVVATEVGGMPEVVVDGETGLLVPPADPERLSAALAKLLLAPELGREMGSAGRRRIEQRYRVEQMVRGVERLYDELLVGRAA
jgi:glycosyltransferase involved in cell wall biosynthesis